MKIQVTQEDIDQGKRGSLKRCPVALAVQRTTKDPTWWVGYFTSWNDTNPTGIPTPKVAMEFAKAFDDDKTLQHPFEFDLPIEETK